MGEIRSGTKCKGKAMSGAAGDDANERTILTERLILAPVVADDFDESFGLWRNPGVVRFIGSKPSSGDEAWARILRYAGLWALLGFGYWAVRERASGRFVGEIGFARFRRGLGPDFDPFPEAGWVFDPAWHGRGFAAEAVSAALAWLEARNGRAKVVCMINPANAPSIRLAERLGFEVCGETVLREMPTRLFERR